MMGSVSPEDKLNLNRKTMTSVRTRSAAKRENKLGEIEQNKEQVSKNIENEDYGVQPQCVMISHEKKTASHETKSQLINVTHEKTMVFCSFSAAELGLCVVGLILFASVGCYFIGFISKSSHTLPLVERRIEQANDMLQNAKIDFQNQSDFAWLILNRTMKFFMKTATPPNKPKQPITMLILGTENKRDFANHFSKRIQKIVTDIFEEWSCDVIKVGKLPNNSDDQLKLDLESKIKSSFEKPCHAILVEDIDHLVPSGLMLLQPYSDDTADNKDVIIILTATTSDRFPEKQDLKSFSSLARKHLENEWNYHNDYRAAWLSRFLQYVVVTIPEKYSVEL